MGRILLFGVFCVGMGLAFLPTKYFSVLREGTDSFETHHALWGQRMKSVSVIADAPVRGVGLLFVNLRRVPTIAPVIVSVGDAHQEVAINTNDDAFTWVRFSANIASAGEAFTVEVAAPLATQDAPVGVRFDTTDKQLAVATIEVIPAWKQVVYWSQNKPELAKKVGITLFGGLILAAILALADRINNKKTWIASLTLLFLFSVIMRIPLTQSVESAYGGDAFNYLLKSRAWIDGQDPFAADPRKAPLYSFLVMPGLAAPFDAVTWERWISMLAAGGSVVVSALFLRRFGLPYSFALAGGALLAVNRDFQFESVQGLANTTFTFFILLTGYLFILGETYWVAVGSGLAFLTRYEGGIVAAILLPVSIVIHKIRGRNIIRVLLPAIILILIPFVFFPITHSLGVRSIADIKGDEGLYVAYSFDDFVSNFKAFRTWFGRLWILTPNLDHLFIQMVSALTTLGLIGGIVRFPKQCIPIVVMLVLHVMFITAILPKDRYYLPLIPYIALAITSGVYALTYRKSRASFIGALIFISMLTLFVYADARQALPGQVSDYNEKSAGQTVLLQAARIAKHLDGIVAIAEGSDLQLRTYLPNARVFIAPDSLRDINDQVSLLRGKNVSYIINTTENPYFTKLISERSELFEGVATFGTKWGEDTATLYRVHFK